MLDGTDGKVPLSYVADIVSTSGPNAIGRENAQRLIVVSANVADRDLRSVVNEIGETIRTQVPMPEGYHVEYGGQFESEQAASRTLTLTSLVALLAASGFGIGMALSGTLQNFAGGIMVMFMHPYRIGDYIEAQGQAGTVKEIRLFSTVVTTTDNKRIYIPNSSISNAIVNNYSSETMRRVEWKVSLAYGDDVAVAKRTMLAMLESDKRVLHTPDAPADPFVALSELADSAIVVVARTWTLNGDYWDLFFDMNERFYNELPQQGLHFPFPQLDVHLDK